MIEFSLMAIDLLFTKTDDSLEGSIPNDSRDVENGVTLDLTGDRNISTHNEGNEWKLKISSRQYFRFCSV